ncbi:MAG: hypothetical protein ABG776_10780 [Cyanobacteria bacterium J06555_13]
MVMAYERGVVPGEPLDEAVTQWTIKVPVAGESCGSIGNTYRIPVTGSD